MDPYTSSFVVSLAVIISRMGLWLLDLSVRQIAQETIDQHKRGSINGTWQSLDSFFIMLSYIFAMIFAGKKYNF